MLEIKDSVAVVTGGASGIGFAFAKYWAQKGGKVLLADVSGPDLKSAKEAIGSSAETLVCNVTEKQIPKNWPTQP